MSNAVRHTPGRASFELVALVRKLQGEESQERFSARLGISQPVLSRFLSGERGATGRLVAGLILAFPGKRDEIVKAWTAGANDRPAAVA